MTETWHSDVSLLHDLLALTPNLVDLSLSSKLKDTKLDWNQKSPISLPHLKRLELNGGTYPSALLEFGLLTSSTFPKVSGLTWIDNSSPSSSAKPLLDLIGPALRTLRYETLDTDRDMVSKLASCTALEELVFCGIQGRRGGASSPPPEYDPYPLIRPHL